MQTFATFARTILWTLLCVGFTYNVYVKEPRVPVYIIIACISGYVVLNNIWVLGNVFAYKLIQYDLNVFRRKLGINCNSTREQYNLSNILTRYELHLESTEAETQLLKDGWSYLEVEACFKTSDADIELKQKFLGYVIKELDKRVLKELEIAI